MKRSEKDLNDLASGELWETFKKTLYFEELEKFCFEKIREFRDLIVQASVSRDYEKSRDLAQQLTGFRMVSDWIDDSISTRVENLEFDKEQKVFEKQLPHRL